MRILNLRLWGNFSSDWDKMLGWFRPLDTGQLMRSNKNRIHLPCNWSLRKKEWTGKFSFLSRPLFPREIRYRVWVLEQKGAYWEARWAIKSLCCGPLSLRNLRYYRTCFLWKPESGWETSPLLPPAVLWAQSFSLYCQPSRRHLNFHTKTFLSVPI